MANGIGKGKAISTETLLVIGAVIFAIVYIGKPETTTQVVTPPANNGGGNTDIDFSDIVEPQLVFTGQRMYVQGTALTSEWVRVIKENSGALKDKGQISMNSGTTDADPNGVYNLYYGENSSTYYMFSEKYTVPAKDAPQEKSAILCTMDTSPTLTAFDEYGRPIDGSTNAPDFATSEQKELSVRVKVSADQCYGNPNAPSDSKNAICFKYVTNASGFTKVDIVADKVNTPYIIGSKNATSGWTIDCYGFKPLADLGYVDITFKPQAHTSFSENDGNNMTILVDDIDFDLNQYTLAEIWGYQDEDNNELGVGGGISIEMDYK